MVEFTLRQTWIIQHASAALQTRKRGEWMRPKKRWTHHAFPGVYFIPEIRAATDGATILCVGLNIHIDTNQPSTPGSMWVEWIAHLYLACATLESDDVPYGDGWQVELQEYTRMNANCFSKNPSKREDFLKAERANGDVHVRFEFNMITVRELLKSRDLLRRMLRNSDANSSDFQICVNGDIFNVHQSVLIESSPFFARMLAIDMRERKEKSVDISNTTSHAAVDALIKAVYHESWHFHGDLELTIEVLELAERYEFNDVKTYCEEALIALMTVDNVLRIVTVADRFQASMLTSSCINLMSDDKAIMESDEWTEFKANIGTKDLALKITEGVIRELRNMQDCYTRRKRRRLS